MNGTRRGSSVTAAAVASSSDMVLGTPFKPAPIARLASGCLLSEGGGVADTKGNAASSNASVRSFVVAFGATRAPTAFSLKGAERTTTVYYKGRAWVKDRLSDADVNISAVSDGD